MLKKGTKYLLCKHFSVILHRKQHKLGKKRTGNWRLNLMNGKSLLTRMDRLLSYIVRLIVCLSGWAKPLARIGLARYEEWSKGHPMKILLLGYNGARNTGADARVVALTQQMEQMFGADEVELTVMTLDENTMKGYFSPKIRLFSFTTFFFFSLPRAISQHHVAVLCEGSTITRTFADALTVYYCGAAGIAKRQGKPCIAYGSEVGHVDGWLGQLCSDLCSDTYFIVRTEESLQNLQALGLKGHVGTDTAWTFQTPEGELWARQQLKSDGWDGKQPLLGVAVINPFCWPVRPSLSKWVMAWVTRDFSQQYDMMYFFSESEERRKKFSHYLQEVAKAANQYQKERNAFVVILGMERLDAEACNVMERQIEGPHGVYTSKHHDVFQMTGLLRQLNLLVTSRYHANVLSMEHGHPVVAVSMDARLDTLMRETGLKEKYLHHVDDEHLSEHITKSIHLAEEHREEIADTLSKSLVAYKEKVEEMSNFFKQWIKDCFSSQEQQA